MPELTKPKLRKNVGCMFAAFGSCVGLRRDGTVEARCGAGLQCAIHFRPNLARSHVWVGIRLVRTKYRGDTGIAAGKERRPFL